MKAGAAIGRVCVFLLIKAIDHQSQSTAQHFHSLSGTVELQTFWGLPLSSALLFFHSCCIHVVRTFGNVMYLLLLIWGCQKNFFYGCFSSAFVHRKVSYNLSPIFIVYFNHSTTNNVDQSRPKTQPKVFLCVKQFFFFHFTPVNTVILYLDLNAAKIKHSVLSCSCYTSCVNMVCSEYNCRSQRHLFLFMDSESGLIQELDMYYSMISSKVMLNLHYSYVDIVLTITVTSKTFSKLYCIVDLNGNIFLATNLQSQSNNHILNVCFWKLFQIYFF